MKLIGSMMIGPGEADRYVTLALQCLAGFCDELRVRIEGYNTRQLHFNGTHELAPIEILSVPESTFFRNEGKARQELLEWTLAGNPTHVLAVDADELVEHGQQLRQMITRYPQVPVWTLEMQEVWRANPDGLQIREDGGWRRHPVPILWKVPDTITPDWRIRPRQLASGRTPLAVGRLIRRASNANVLHFGWTDPANRQERHHRYAVADGGRYHRSQHLDSILWPDSRVTLLPRPWPTGVEFEELAERFTEVPA